MVGLIPHTSQATTTCTNRRVLPEVQLFEIQNLDIVTGALDSVAPNLSDLMQDVVPPIVNPISLISLLQVILPVLWKLCRVTFLEVPRNKILLYALRVCTMHFSQNTILWFYDSHSSTDISCPRFLNICIVLWFLKKRIIMLLFTFCVQHTIYSSASKQTVFLY